MFSTVGCRFLSKTRGRVAVIVARQLKAVALEPTHLIQRSFVSWNNINNATAHACQQQQEEKRASSQPRLQSQPEPYLLKQELYIQKQNETRQEQLREGRGRGRGETGGGATLPLPTALKMELTPLYSFHGISERDMLLSEMRHHRVSWRTISLHFGISLMEAFYIYIGTVSKALRHGWTPRMTLLDVEQYIAPTTMQRS
ncbi:hypothetical protein BX616_000421 [Lobosporangium transversale]|uniref:Uncharacterized protein n=1 Tax=Lobosporangium transversale TaxID=64571 RepID=A0A1Y2H0G9_9FUNG|nr:hypothetical protein BCR41DRAFT_347543 [Lobosporangium transversale]KAF9907428.1 hypothetical protein BX616_000421 [Lobosporangium transversale]ORZ26562.1 hypothetical protein BCR41DRAFT_347543 [Lobosporangium transversale]|eukprot:XP_021884325.1 hypothetical protein BCR41DRAFT_347543 [Lobosporangium transversale]